MTGDTLRWFSQFWSGSGGCCQTWESYHATSQIGVRHTFRTLYEPGCGCLRATVDSTTIDTSNFNPFTWFGDRPWSPQFSEEANYRESYIPGFTATPAAYTGMGAQRYVDDVIESMPCILNLMGPTSPLWGHSSSSCTAVHIYTIGP